MNSLTRSGDFNWVRTSGYFGEPLVKMTTPHVINYKREQFSTYIAGEGDNDHRRRCNHKVSSRQSASRRRRRSRKLGISL